MPFLPSGLAQEGHVVDPKFFIPIPENDPFFDGKSIGFVRDAFVGGESSKTPRQQINVISSYLDLSHVLCFSSIFFLPSSAFHPSLLSCFLALASISVCFDSCLPAVCRSQ